MRPSRSDDDAVVFCTTEDAACEEQVRVLARDQRLIVWRAPPGPRVAEHAASLARALDRRAVARVHLVALGRAAPVALGFAARHPGRVRSLVLSDPRGVDGCPVARCPVLIVVASAGHGGDATLARWAGSFPDARAVVIPRHRGSAHGGDDAWSDVVRHFLDFVAAG